MNEHIYGYAYYQPISAKKKEVFQFPFTTYQLSKWNLVGFYLEASFVSGGPPRDERVLREKKRHFLELKSQNGLGKQWSGLTDEGIVRLLTKEARWLHWKVHVKNAVRLPVPIEIPKGIYTQECAALSSEIGSAVGWLSFAACEAPRMKVIFLDIDGVLINNTSLLMTETVYVPDKKCVQLLNALIKQTCSYRCGIASLHWQRDRSQMGRRRRYQRLGIQDDRVRKIENGRRE